MARKITRSTPKIIRLPGNCELAGLLESLFSGTPGATGLFLSFFNRTKSRRRFVSELNQTARGTGQPWETRRLAVLMLEHEALLLWKRKVFEPESEWLLSELGLLVNGRVRASVLKEGFTTTEPIPFAMQLRTRLMRLQRIHDAMDGWNTTPAALLDFVHTASRECKLTLARYLFDPEDTARRILEQVRSTTGLAPSGAGDLPWHNFPHICDTDGMLTHALRRGRKILWVSPATSSELNSLVEYPLGTVALVIKPPGSDVEFEVKRAGMRGVNVLDVLYDREGTPVPIPHRLQGASSGSTLEFEVNASRRFSAIYRETHGVEPPMSRLLGYAAVTHVPNGHEPVHVLDYLSKSDSFSGDFGRMRAHLRRCVEAYEGDNPRHELAGEFGLTMRFFERVLPNQAWIEGTTSFRLDRLALLLSPAGPDSYFRQGLGREFSPQDERRLADELLEEVLGTFLPPGNWTDYDTYIGDTLAMEPNRAAADAAYLDAIGEAGKYWGTLLATGGYSEGESFVTRNVGLKNRWINGAWRPRICFMDHDNLHVPGTRDVASLALTMEHTRKDEKWLYGDADANIMACLRKIYRPLAGIEQSGERLLRQSIAQAFRATREAFRNCEPVRRMFQEDYVDSLEIRDNVVHLYLAGARTRGAITRWRKTASRMMKKTVYAADTIPAFLDYVAGNELLQRRYELLGAGAVV